jgi:hypothetical protein
MRISKYSKWIIVITVIYIFLLVILFCAGRLNPEAHIINILLGLCSGLIAWILTQGVLGWINEDETYRHIKHTEEIFNIIKSGFNLVKKSRKDLEEGYYTKLYTNVSCVKICGIANTKLLESLLNNKTQGRELIESLKNNSNVDVQILLADPDSEFTKVRNQVEKPYSATVDPCSNDINKCIAIAEMIADNFSNIKLKNNNRLLIKLTTAPLSIAMTYTKKMDNIEEELLLGLILHHDLGKNLPIYKIRKNEDELTSSRLFEHCSDHFKALFEDENRSRAILNWDCNGICYKNQIQPIDT